MLKNIIAPVLTYIHINSEESPQEVVGPDVEHENGYDSNSTQSLNVVALDPLPRRRYFAGHVTRRRAPTRSQLLLTL